MLIITSGGFNHQACQNLASKAVAQQCFATIAEVVSWNWKAEGSCEQPQHELEKETGRKIKWDMYWKDVGIQHSPFDIPIRCVNLTSSSYLLGSKHALQRLKVLARSALSHIRFECASDSQPEMNIAAPCDGKTPG